MEKEKWLDNMRAIACILVAFGHLFNGSIEIYSLNKDLFMMLNSLLYKIHVPIFFFCSGYLLQNHFRGLKRDSYISYTVKKIINLGIPYVVFCLLTYVVKIIFPTAVNSQINKGIFESLFVLPPNQMWFLFVLIVCFIITPIGIKSTIHAIGLEIISFLMYLSYKTIGNNDLVYYKILYFYIWFVLGMIINYFGIAKRKFSKEWILCFVFFAFFITDYFYSYLGVFEFIITFVGNIWIMFLCRNLLKDKNSKILEYISRYMLQIYLLHTIFAVAIRVVLRRISIYNGYIHLVVGLIGCIGLSILVAFICEKLVYPNFVFYPIKTIKQIKEKWRK